MKTVSVFLPGKSHGQRTLVGYPCTWDSKEPDALEHVHTYTYTEELKVETDICMLLFIAALFTTAKGWK